MKNYCISKRPTSLTCVLYFPKRVKYWMPHTEIRSVRPSVTEKSTLPPSREPSRQSKTLPSCHLVPPFLAVL